jgi:hypothetical protein
MEIVNLSKKVPTEREIAEIEGRLAQMKLARKKANESVFNSVKANIEQLPEYLDSDTQMKLLKILQNRFRHGHRKVRGSTVPPVLKEELKAAIKSGAFTLGEMSKTFNLSISYISNVKKGMRDSGELAGGYVDRPMTTQQPQQSVA